MRSAAPPAAVPAGPPGDPASARTADAARRRPVPSPTEPPPPAPADTRRPADKVIQQHRLAHARVPADHEHLALPRQDRLDEPVENAAFPAPAVSPVARPPRRARALTWPPDHWLHKSTRRVPDRRREKFVAFRARLLVYGCWWREATTSAFHCGTIRAPRTVVGGSRAAVPVSRHHLRWRLHGGRGGPGRRVDRGLGCWRRVRRTRRAGPARRRYGAWPPDAVRDFAA